MTQTDVRTEHAPYCFYKPAVDIDAITMQEWADMGVPTGWSIGHLVHAGIKNNNHKVHGLIWNVLAKFTCGQAWRCREYCYCGKGPGVFSTVRKAHLRNTYATTRQDFVPAFIDDLRRKKTKVLRWHAAGDIYSVLYWNKMRVIAAQTPHMRHYVYTKAGWAVRGTLHDKPSNLQVLLSVDGVENNTIMQRIMWDDAQASGYDGIVFVVNDGTGDCPAVIRSAKNAHLRRSKQDTLPKIMCNIDCHRCAYGGGIIRIDMH